MTFDADCERCRICANGANNRTFLCKEKMFGWGDEFRYFQCANCGCLQIASVPNNLGRFYPAAYQSFRSSPIPLHGWKPKLAAVRDSTAATGPGIFRALINCLSPLQADLASLGNVPATKKMRVLDVGCGGGQLLAVLHRAGFEHLTGIDPFLQNDNLVAPNVFARKLSLDQIHEKFDLIMLHHVFEHMPDGLETLRLCGQRLMPGGKILLRFPTAESDAWDHYRENWVQLDAPRHLFLHTRSSFQLLAKHAGLEIEQWFCDSWAVQFWGSELYRRGCPLFDHTGAPTALKNYFSPKEMKGFVEKAKKANALHRGDQVVVILSDTSN